MQRLSYDLVQALDQVVSIHVVKWGHSQIFLPFFVTIALTRSLLFSVTHDLYVIHVGDVLLAPLGLLLKHLLNVPVVVTAHGLDVTFDKGSYQWIIRKSLPRLDHVICISRQAQQECLVRGVTDEKSSVIPVGINPKRFFPPDQSIPLDGKPSLRLSEPFNEEDKVILLTVGRLTRRKGVAWFIQNVMPFLATRFPLLVYWVVGEGPDRPAIENTIIQQGLQDRVILFGDVDDAGLMTAYRLADLFIMPNIYVPGDVEGFGIVALEAALNKVCVVASRLEGIVDAITDQKNGILVPPGDTVAYVQTIETLLNQTEQRRQCAQNAQQFTIARFSWSKIVGQYLEVYSSVSNDSALPIKKA